MIPKKTVLVLGAGASVDYGFPTGRRMLLDICREVRVGSELYRFFTERRADSSTLIESFIEALENSQAPSVDLFLEKESSLRRSAK